MNLHKMNPSPKPLEIFRETCTSLEIFSEIRWRGEETEYWFMVNGS